MLANQEVFDKVLTEIVKQGKPSVRKECGKIICAYRGDDGSKCAAGHLVDDEDYNAGKVTEDVGVTHESNAPYFETKVENLTFLKMLQNCHDSAYSSGEEFIPAFLKKMKFLAETYDLVFDLSKV